MGTQNYIGVASAGGAAGAGSNILINGGMNVAQRGISATISAGLAVPTASLGYSTVDMWYGYAAGGDPSIGQVAGSGTTLNRLQVTGALGTTAIGIGQRVGRFNAVQLAGNTASLSVDLSNSLLTSVAWAAFNPTPTLIPVTTAEATIAVGTNPNGVAFCPSNNNIYVVNTGSSTVSVINITTNLVVTTIGVGTSLNGVAFCPSNNNMYVTNGSASGSVSVINPTTNLVVTTIAVGSDPVGLAFCPSNNNMYVANYGSGNVSVINPTTNLLVTTIPTGGGAMAVAYSAISGNIYVANYTANTVSIINPSTNLVIATIAGFSSPTDVCECPSNNNIYVTNRGDNTVRVINPSTNLVIATIGAGNQPSGMAYCMSTDRIYVANIGGTTVSVINPVSNTLSTTITVGTSPNGVAYSPVSNKIYATNYGGGTVSVVNPANNIVNSNFGTIAAPTKTQIASGTFTVSPTLTRYSASFPCGVDVSRGVEIVFTVGAQTSGTWVIGNAKLELGTAATAYANKTIQAEIEDCQRYFWINQSAHFSTVLANHYFKSTMRDIPVITWAGTGATISAITTDSIVATASSPQTRLLTASAQIS